MIDEIEKIIEQFAPYVAVDNNSTDLQYKVTYWKPDVVKMLEMVLSSKSELVAWMADDGDIESNRTCNLNQKAIMHDSTKKSFSIPLQLLK